MAINPPYSRAALEGLVRSLRGVDLSDWIDPEEIEYESDRKIAEEAVTHHVLRKVFTNVLGANVGENADWVNPTWHLGRGRANRDSGEPYLFEGDYGAEYHILVSTWDEDGDNQEIEEIKILDGKDELLRWAEKTLASLDDRRNPSVRPFRRRDEAGYATKKRHNPYTTLTIKDRITIAEARVRETRAAVQVAEAAYGAVRGDGRYPAATDECADAHARLINAGHAYSAALGRLSALEEIDDDQRRANDNGDGRDG